MDGVHVPVSLSVLDIKIDKKETSLCIVHLLTDEDLLSASKSMWERLNPGGLFLASIRDYDQIVQERPQVTQPRVLDDGNRIVFQAWEWQQNTNMYNVSQLLLEIEMGNGKQRALQLNTGQF